jgi:Arc/MetJ-type ribon-helix-helix transcriptional regulator
VGGHTYIEIHKPELEQRVRLQIQSGRFHDVDDLLSRALDALEESGAPPVARKKNLPDVCHTERGLAENSVFEQGLGLFSSPEDAALIDEVVSIAYEERRRPAEDPLL